MTAVVSTVRRGGHWVAWAECDECGWAKPKGGYVTEDTARDHADRHNTNVHRDDPLEARS